jgi:hypothetical protein
VVVVVVVVVAVAVAAVVDGKQVDYITQLGHVLHVLFCYKHKLEQCNQYSNSLQAELLGC